MPPAARLDGGADAVVNVTTSASAGGLGSGGSAADDASRLHPPQPPDDHPTLKLLQDGDLFGGAWHAGSRDVPLLVPFPNGAVTNMYGARAAVDKY